MKKILLFSLATTVMAGGAWSQTQIGNSDMENWETVSGSDQEPVNWNSFLTAQGQFNNFAANQIAQDPDVRPGSTGTSSARIWARDAGFGITANGNMTLGRINMGAISANDPNNYNISLTADPDFSETNSDMPDSIVFWAKFNANNGSEEARMKATLHTNNDYRDPEDATSSTWVVATAVHNFAPTNGWVRFSIPFDYSGPASGNTHILVTFTTNKTPGGGDPNDEVFVDDVELIYNPSGGVDTDGDGVIDTTEGTDGTDPNDLCSFILASQTVPPSSTWNTTDCDFDGVSNADEVTNGTDPLVNNNAGLEDLNGNDVMVSLDNVNNVINVVSNNSLNGSYAIYNTLGQVIQRGAIAETIAFDQDPGMYFVHLITDNGAFKYEIYKK